MIFRSINEIEIPALGFGTYQLKKNTCIESVLNALETGYRHIDTAEMYGNESEVGDALNSSDISREKLFVTSKVWHENLSQNDMKDAVSRSLDKLKTDYLDLYLIHWPSTKGVPLEESLETLMEIKESGLTRLAGVSNFPPKLFKKALEYDISNIQVEYHPFLNQTELLEMAEENEILFTAYSPIAHGKVFESDLLKELAEKYVKNASQVALRWLLQQNNVMAIPRSSKKDHIRSNFEIFDFEISDEDMQKLFDLEGNRRLIDPEFAPEW